MKKASSEKIKFSEMGGGIGVQNFIKQIAPSPKREEKYASALHCYDFERYPVGQD